MIITTRSGKSFDTESDLTAPERHILQKLFFWKSMAVSVHQFREKASQAILKGWNDSGPVTESQTLKAIISDLEQKLVERLNTEGEKKS